MNQKTRRVSLTALAILIAIPLTHFLLKDETSPSIEAELTKSELQVLRNAPRIAETEQLTVVETSTDQSVDGERDISDNPFFEAETKARLIQISQDFAEDIQYPDYAKPIRNNDELHKYLPNVSVESSLPLDSRSESGPSISIKASKLQYFRGETIIADATISGLTGTQSISAQGRLVDSGNILSESEGLQQSASGHVYRLIFQSEEIPEINGSGELRLIATFNINNRTYELGTPVQYLESVASVDYVAGAMVNDSFLEIPVYITSYQPGYHQISANLYDADTGKPLVHITAEKELLVENDFILLKSHIVSLKAAGSEGPYILKDFTLTRMPSAPTFMTEYGKVPEEGIAINGFSFGEYRDEPYEDAEAKERLEFLSKLGGGA